MTNKLSPRHICVGLRQHKFFGTSSRPGGKHKNLILPMKSIGMWPTTPGSPIFDVHMASSRPDKWGIAVRSASSATSTFSIELEEAASCKKDVSASL